MVNSRSTALLAQALNPRSRYAGGTGGGGGVSPIAEPSLDSLPGLSEIGNILGTHSAGRNPAAPDEINPLIPNFDQWGIPPAPPGSSGMVPDISPSERPTTAQPEQGEPIPASYQPPPPIGGEVEGGVFGGPMRANNPPIGSDMYPPAPMGWEMPGGVFGGPMTEFPTSPPMDQGGGLPGAEVPSFDNGMDSGGQSSNPFAADPFAGGGSPMQSSSMDDLMEFFGGGGGGITPGGLLQLLMD